MRDQYHQSVAAFIQGDPGVQKPLWSRRDDVTLANPLGPPAKGFDAVCQIMDSAASQISEGDGYWSAAASRLAGADQGSMLRAANQPS